MIMRYSDPKGNAKAYTTWIHRPCMYGLNVLKFHANRVQHTARPFRRG